MEILQRSGIKLSRDITAFRHSKGIIKDLPKTPRTLLQYCTDRFEGGPRIIPQYADRRQLRGWLMKTSNLSVKLNRQTGKKIHLLSKRLASFGIMEA